MRDEKHILRAVTELEFIKTCGESLDYVLNPGKIICIIYTALLRCRFQKI